MYCQIFGNAPKFKKLNQKCGAVTKWGENYNGWAKKRPFLQLITLRRLVVERHVICQKFADFVRKKCKTCECIYLLTFHSTYSETTTIISTHG